MYQNDPKCNIMHQVQAFWRFTDHLQSFSFGFLAWCRPVITRLFLKSFVKWMAPPQFIVSLTISGNNDCVNQVNELNWGMELAVVWVSRHRLSNSQHFCFVDHRSDVRRQAALQPGSLGSRACFQTSFYVSIASGWLAWQELIGARVSMSSYLVFHWTLL